MLSDFEVLYGARGSGRNTGIDAAYSPPARFVHAEQARVARFAARGAGQEVEVYEERWPASFWAVQVLETAQPAGVVRQGFCLATGSGFEAGQLAFALARAIAAGQLGVCDALPAHAKTARVFRFGSQDDGQDVELYEGNRGSASPWIIKASGASNAIGGVKEEFCLAIDVGTLAFAVAQAVSEGMLGLRQAS